MREKTRVFGVLAAAVAGLVAGTVLAAAPASAIGSSTTVLGSSINPSTVGQAVTLTAVVTGSAPGGEVVFADSGVALAAGVPLVAIDASTSAASLVVSTLAVGSHSLTAAYGGDANNDVSSAALTQTVVAPPPPPVKVKKAKLHFAASTHKLSVGQKVRLSWRSKHADWVKASGEWNGQQKAKGSVTLRINERGKHVFKLTAGNARGARTAKVTVMASRKAKEFEIVVTDELTMVGTDVDLAADGLAGGEEYRVRLDDEVILVGHANPKGEVKRTFEVAKTTEEGELPLTITGSNPRRVGATVLNVIKPKTFQVTVEQDQLKPKEKQTLTVIGLFPGEELTVVFGGTKLTSGEADEAGAFTYEFPVGTQTGERTVKVIGADPSRNGEATFKVVKPGSPEDPTNL